MMIIVSVFITSYLISVLKTTVSANDDQALKQQEQLLISKFNKSFLRDTNYSENNDIQVSIVQWSFNDTLWTLESLDNLVSYKWFILPRYFIINKNTTVKDISYFGSWNYDIKYIMEFMENFIFIKANLSNEMKYPNLSISLDKSIVDKFNISCSNSNILIYNTVCNSYIERFLDVWFVYNLTNDVEWLTNTFLTINKKYKEEYLSGFCKVIDNYTKYSNNTDRRLENIVNYCDSKTIDWFYLLQGFIEIQKQLVDWYINKHSYNNSTLNYYKLISYQETIYNDFVRNDINPKHLSFYIEYLKELVKKNRINWFYLDVTYLFNNYFILNSLNDKNFSTDAKTEMNDIIYNLNKLNQWDEIIWLEGIEDHIQNQSLKKLVSEKNNYTTIPEEIIYESENWTGNFDKAVSTVKNLSFLRITEQEINWSGISITWYINIKDKDIYWSFSLLFDGENILIKRTYMTGRENLNNFLNIALSKNDFTLPQFYEYVTSYIDLYTDWEEVDESKLFCSSLESSVTTAKLNQCTGQKVQLVKDNWDKWSISYTFELSWYQIVKLSISDKIIDARFKNKIQNIETDQINIINTISEIVSYQDKSFDTSVIVRTWSNDTLIIIERIQKYLWIKVSDIAEKVWKYAFEFSIKWITFYCLYDINTHTMWQIFFKDIRVNNLPYLIDNFTLSLNENNKNKINEFLFDPISYIRKISPSSYEKYILEKDKQ